MSNIDDIPKNIRKFRELKNITREHMANDLEMSLSGYAKIERGETEITVQKLYRIAEILDINVSQIMNFDASQIFNISNNENIHSIGSKDQVINIITDQMKDKYINLLESEVERLKGLINK